MTKKKLRFGAVPVFNMPKRRHYSNKPTLWPDETVLSNLENSSTSSCYSTFSEFCDQVKSIETLCGWNVKFLVDQVVFQMIVEPYLLSVLEIIVDDSLGFTVKVLGSYLVDNHPLYLQYRRSMQNVTMSDLLKGLEIYRFCDGVHATELTSKLYHHVIPITHDFMTDEQEEQFPHKAFWRTRECLLISREENNICSACMEYVLCTENARKVKESRLAKPAHLNAPVSKTNPERIKLTLQQQRLKCAQLEQALNEIRLELLNRSRVEYITICYN